MLSLLIPCFNEQGAIEATVRTAAESLRATGEPFEIVVINDGSSDASAQVLGGLNIPELKVRTHSVNQGYSASLKNGIRKSSGEVIAMLDADGTYPVKEIGTLVHLLKEKNVDMVVGARTKAGVQIPWVRRPAKWVINKLANTLTGMKIPDLNSGMRVFTRSLAEQFMHLYPKRFSFTTTITLAALTNDYQVHFEPIEYYKRTGKSTMSSGFNGVRHFLQFMNLIVRIVTYFRPLRFFAWPSAILMVAGLATIVDTLMKQDNISDAGLLLLLTGLQIGLFGMLAEIVVRHRRA